MTAAAGSRPGATPALRLGVVVLIAAGTALRLHDLERSLWLDEAWVANAIEADTIAGMLRYERWLQTTPPLLLLLARLGRALLGPANEALRAVPALLGILSVPLFAAVALRTLRPPFALWALLLLAISPELAWYGSSLKQYGADVFCACALLWAGLAYLERPGPRRLAWALAAFVPLALLSHVAFYFVGPFFLGAWLGRAGGARGRTAGAEWRAPLAALGVVGGVGALVWLAFVQPNTSPELYAFFRDGFPPRGRPGAWPAYWGGRIGMLADTLPFTRAGGPLRFGVLAVAGIGVVAWMVRDGGRRVGRAALVALPCAGFALANLLGWMPWSVRGLRVLLFLSPPVALAFAAGCQVAADAALPVRLRERGSVWVAGFLVAACLAGVVFQARPTGFGAWLRRGPTQEAEAAVAALAAHASPADRLYVHASVLEQFLLYARRTPVRAGTIVEGRIGAPCCPRATALDWGEPAERVLPSELERILASPPEGELLLLATDHSRIWELVGRDDHALLLAGLAQRGCSPSADRRFDGIRWTVLDCTPEGAAP